MLMAMMWDAASSRQVWKAEQPVNVGELTPTEELRTVRERPGLSGVHETWNGNDRCREPYDIRGELTKPLRADLKIGGDSQIEREFKELGSFPGCRMLKSKEKALYRFWSHSPLQIFQNPVKDSA
jgi:hypothetical protein